MLKRGYCARTDTRLLFINATPQQNKTYTVGLCSNAGDLIGPFTAAVEWTASTCTTCWTPEGQWHV